MKERPHIAIKQKNLILKLLPDSLPENLANADCFEERNESEVPVFDLSRASGAENHGVAINHSINC